jgi:hypothetical protein
MISLFEVKRKIRVIRVIRAEKNNQTKYNPCQKKYIMNKIQDIEEQEKLKSLVPELNKKFSDAPAEDIVGYFLQAFKGRIALSSSLNIGSDLINSPTAMMITRNMEAMVKRNITCPAILSFAIL